MTASDKRSLIEALRKNAFHGDSARNKPLNELADLFVERRYPRKKMLVLAGEKWDKVFFVHKGIIRLYYTDNEGREFNKGFFHEGHLVWPIAPSAREKDSLFSIAALEDVRISICAFASFYSWLNRNGCWEKIALPYAELFAEEKFKREHDFLLLSATERYQRFYSENPGLVRRIPDYHLATYLGITNVSLSRIRKRIGF